MKTCPTTRRVSRSLDHALLASVLVHLEQHLLDADAGHGAVVFGLVETDDDGFTIATHHLDVADPVQAMIGFTAPAGWSAFGLVSRGRSRPLLDRAGPLRADLDAEAAPVRLALVVARSGLAVSGLRSGDGPFVVADDGGEVVGRMPDLCRRVLGLGTPPPEAPVEELFAQLWLDQVLAEAVAHPGQLTWAQAVDLHFGAGPVDEVCAALDDAERSSSGLADGCGPLSPEERLSIGHALVHEHTSWSFVRRKAARLGEANDIFDPAAAIWMDDGMYSRELLASFPPVSLVLEALEQVAKPDVAAGMARSLAAWGVV